MNMTNSDTLNAAAGNTVKSESSGTFRFLMHAQNTPKSVNEDPKTDNPGLLMLNILSRQGQGEMLKIKAKITDIGGENDEQDSICSDSNLQNLVDGIVGILEGFGLLDYNMDESALDEISEFIVSMVNNQDGNSGTDANAGNMKAFLHIFARMPNAEQFQPLAQEAQEAVRQLIGEYQCSLDNTNNSGVWEAGQENENPQSQEADGADRIKMMLKASINKSGSSKIKQFGPINTKASDELESKNDTDETAEKTLPFKQQPEALKPTRYQTDKTIEQVTKDDMAENVARIAEKITSRQMEGKREFDVTLKPEFLGKLSIKLVMEGESIKAHIKAADQYVKGLISEQLPELSQALKEKGVNMTNIEVTYESPMWSSTDQQFHGHSQNMAGSEKGMGSYAAGENDIENISFIDAVDQTDLFLKNGSVEFSA
jgi:hypothetical protein